jgi:signal transduction histidine kinase/ActR/RegA family two-component response regulator
MARIFASADSSEAIDDIQTMATIINSHRQRRLSTALGLYALLGGTISFSGWAFDIPRLADWFNDGVSIQPNTCVLIALAGAAALLVRFEHRWITLTFGAFVAAAGGLNLLQHIMGADFGFNHQLLFGRGWGQQTTVSPGRFGPPASISFVLIGTALVLLSLRNAALRRHVPGIALVVVLLLMFSLLGYLFGARDFYAIPWLSAIALQTSTMLLALAVSLIVSVPEHQPMLLLCERSSAGAMARTVLPILAIMIPSVTWFRNEGHELKLFDLGTGRALSTAVLMLGVVALMWIALLALRRREQREREADRRKDEFLAMLAHELRNPLAPIHNALSILKLSYNDRGTFDRTTAMIGRQLTQLVRLIDDLLDVNRISTGKLELRRERVELAAIVYQAIETCRPMADLTNQEITVTLPPEPIYLDADPIRLSQVISNLLNNACKFSGQRGRITLTAGRRDNEVAISVKDNGIGIPADKLDSIFEMFSQVDQSLEKSHGGLGIGLTLARRLSELHGGAIEARSEGLGKGSEFVIRLPVTSGQVSQTTEEPQVEIRPSGNRRILVVDDNQDSADSLAMLLRLAGNETSVAYDGEAAVEAAARQRPDVIFLDIGLPRLNGFDACRRIRENRWAENVLIIALTGWGQKEDRRKSAEAGFDGHLVKPVAHAELMRVLAHPFPQVKVS